MESEEVSQSEVPAGSPSTGRESMGVSGLEFNMDSASANKVALQTRGDKDPILILKPILS